MTRASNTGALLVLVTGLASVGCAPNPVEDCERVCAEQRDRMCNGSDGTENCVAQCMNAGIEYDEAVVIANRFGCRSEFDSFYGCLVGGDPCATDRCTVEVNAVQTCSMAFCRDNPTDPECGP